MELYEKYRSFCIGVFVPVVLFAFIALIIHLVMVLDVVKVANILFASLIAGIIILFVSLVIVEWILATTVNGEYKQTGFYSICGFSAVYILNYMWFSVMLSWYQETRVLADTIFPDYYPVIILIIALIYMGVASLCYNTWVRIMNVEPAFGTKPFYNYYGCWGYEVKSTWGTTTTFIPLIKWHKTEDEK